ncbi:DUF2332 domain-containing protein [Ferroacidibacillus organovorans]|uniref:DUF2332 domain-containing protein n=1 Tax=Ferroacidibacillus organovorans TaxID=1765683 RepID=A0A853K8D0_9BACL|nr:DUF2332 domain-containing protein [Ferroacidibacillus organovorans]KYP80245.1 hypothetical protein AYJ22_12100 [Ferroacidibacillus organovorans]OAG93215.1 hypothetical protein AYW79_11790 [Ferroacidibacillus organovorans]
MNSTHLSAGFRRFAEKECKGSSRLYEFLSIEISRDTHLLELSSHCSQGQPVPNLLFASVHYLLLSGVDHELKAFYLSVTGNPRPFEGSFPPFKNFCQNYRNEMIRLLQSKMVQTNEIRRCTYFYPSFCYIYNKVRRPLSLVEIGTSAGLQLLWDKYSYSYGTDSVYGDLSSSVHLTSELRSGNALPLLQKTPPVKSKFGIDLHVVDLSKKEDYLWLKSLIWPEHKERLEVLEKAAQLFTINSVNLIEGDGVSLLPHVVEQVPEDSALCIFHTHVANQIPDELKRKLIDNIKAIGTKRDVFHLYNNISDVGKLHLDSFINGVEFNEIIAETDGHGRWFDWYVNM